MAKLIALDTSAVVFLMANEPSAEPDLTRWTNVHETFRRYNSAGASFFIPSPVIAELCAGGATAVQIAKALSTKGRDLHIAPLDGLAADKAGQMIAKTLPEKRPEDIRPKMKFDALIAGVAVAVNADAVCTTDGKDYARYLSAVGSAIEIIQADVLQGQLVIASITK